MCWKTWVWTSQVGSDERRSWHSFGHSFLLFCFVFITCASQVSERYKKCRIKLLQCPFNDGRAPQVMSSERTENQHISRCQQSHPWNIYDRTFLLNCIAIKIILKLFSIHKLQNYMPVLTNAVYKSGNDLEASGVGFSFCIILYFLTLRFIIFSMPKY